MANDTREVATKVLEIYRRLPGEIDNPDSVQALVAKCDALFAQLKKTPLPKDLLILLSRECKKAQKHLLVGLDNLDKEMKKTHTARRAQQTYGHKT